MPHTPGWCRHWLWWFSAYLPVSHAKDWFLVPLMKQHCRDGSVHSEGSSKLDPFEIFDNFDIPSSSNHRHWSFAFTHASTSSKCILFAIQCLSPVGYYFESPWDVDWIVSEMIDWLKVSNPTLIKEIFCNPDIWEESNSRSSTAGSADCLDGRYTQENWRGNSDSEAEGYWWRVAMICRVGKCDPKVSNYVIWVLS